MKCHKQSTSARGLFLLLFWMGLAPVGMDPCCAQTSGQNAGKEAPGFWEQLKAVLNKKKTAENDPQSVTSRYGRVYDWIHREERQLYDSLSKTGVANWDRRQNIVSVHYDRAKDTSLSNNLAPNIKVFGWHPYWMGTAYESYQFNLLSYLSWFSYNIDSTGHHDNPEVVKMWKAAQPLRKAAHAHRCKVLLTITNHTKAGNAALLKSPQLQDVLIDDLIGLLDETGGDGIDVNFELVPPGLKRNMTAFLQTLSQALKRANPAYVLTLDVPAYGWESIYELTELDKYVDFFVMTGYDYYGKNSRRDGPMAPLDAQNGPSIRNSVQAYLAGGLKRDKLILALPYYGAVWTGQTAHVDQADNTLRFEGYLTYRAMRAKYAKEKPAYDLERWGGHYSVYNRDLNHYEKCWFDDSITLGRKYSWVLQQKLAGVGIWALGYDNGYPELWNLIATKYASDTLLVYKDVYLESKYFRLSKSLMEYRSLMAVSGIFIVLFLMAGLVIAMFDWRVREVFFQNKTLRLLYALSGFAIPLCIYAFYIYIGGHSIPKASNLPALGAGLLLGVCLTLYINHFFEKNRRMLP